jgi:hypothetical protein
MAWIPLQSRDRIWYYYQGRWTLAYEVADIVKDVDVNTLIITITEAQNEGVGFYLTAGNKRMVFVENPAEGAWEKGTYNPQRLGNVDYLVDEIEHEMGHFFGAGEQGSVPNDCAGYGNCLMSYCRTRPFNTWGTSSPVNNVYCEDSLNHIRDYAAGL